MSDFRDIQHGVNDPVDGLDVKRQITTTGRRMNGHNAMQTCVPRPLPRRASHFCPNGFGASLPIQSTRGAGGDRRISR